MTDGFGADPGAMEALASLLRNAGVTLSTIGETVPATPDAGEVSGDMAAVLAHFTAGAAELVTGVTAAGDQVAAGGQDYGESEDATRRAFQSPI